jgi:hypothetical protein
VQRGSVGCGVAQGEVRVRRGSVQGAVWLSSGRGMAQFRVRHGSVRVRCGAVQGAVWLS